MTEGSEGDYSFLYISLYFDEDVSAGIVENLQTRGFDVLSARDADALGRPDDEQMLFAVSQRRAVVTHNRVDFEKQHRKFLESGVKQLRCDHRQAPQGRGSRRQLASSIGRCNR